MHRGPDDVRLAVLMVDGVDLKGRTNVVALGITTDGVKIPPGLWEGSTENAAVATALLSDLVDRGLDVEQGVPASSTARRRSASSSPRRARRPHAGAALCPAIRAQRPRPPARSATGPGEATAAASVARDDHERALDELRSLAGELERSHPGAATSLREGLEETLTLQRLGIRGTLKQTLASTNPCESMIECVRRTSRNVKRWQSGDMALRWTAAGMLEAERQFRRVIGYRDLAKLAVAIERDLAHTTVLSPTKETATLITA
jgi:transposase-like protein